MIPMSKCLVVFRKTIGHAIYLAVMLSVNIQFQRWSNDSINGHVLSHTFNSKWESMQMIFCWNGSIPFKSSLKET